MTITPAYRLLFILLTACISLGAIAQNNDRATSLVMKGRKIMIPQPSQAEKYFDSAVRLSTQNNDSNSIVKGMIAKGELVLYVKKDFPKALDAFYKALDITPRQSKALQGSIYIKIAETLFQQGFVAAAGENLNRSLSLLTLSKDSSELQNAFNIYGTIFLNSANPDSAIYYLERSLSVMPAATGSLEKSFVLHNIGRAYNMKKQFGIALHYHTEALKLKLRIGEKKQLGMSYLHIANVYMAMKNTGLAMQYYNLAKPYALRSGNLYETKALYYGLSQAAEQKGNFRSAFNWLQKYYSVKDSLYNIDRIKVIKQSEEKYENTKKENEIAALKYSNTLAGLKNEAIQKQQRNQQFTSSLIISGLVAFIILLGSLIFLLRSRNRQQQKINAANILIAEQKLTEAEKAATIESYNKFIVWQEEERNRMAKDLHDTLGGLLSGIKLTLSKTISNNKNADAGSFDRTFLMLDKAHEEIRKIAHDVMPENLRRYGLIVAIEDYVNEIKMDSDIRFELEYNDDLGELDSNTTVNLYRIVHELINNTLKYAGASEVLLQFTRNNGSLFLLYEDNGKGFILEKAMEKGGMGLKSIETRTDYLKGKLTIDPAPDSGTTILIEVPLSS